MTIASNTLIGVLEPSPTGIAHIDESAVGVHGLQLSHGLSTHAFTYCMLRTYHYESTVLGSTWHHHICLYHFHLQLAHATHAMKQEGNMKYFTAPYSSTCKQSAYHDQQTIQFQCVLQALPHMAVLLQLTTV